MNIPSTRQGYTPQTRVLTHSEANPLLPPLRPFFSYRRVRKCLPEFLDRRLAPHEPEMFFGSTQGC